MQSHPRSATIAVVALSLLIALTGCAGAPRAKATPVANGIATLTPAESDKFYLSLLHAMDSFTEMVSEDVLVYEGEKLCKELRAGSSPDEIVAINEENKMDSGVERDVFAIAPAAYCPEWSKRMGTWLSQN